MFGNSVRHFIYKIYGFISAKKLATSVYVVSSSSCGNLSYFLRILNWSCNDNKIISLTDRSLEGRCWSLSPCRVRGRSVLRVTGKRSAVVSGDRSKQCQDWGAWLLKKMISVNQLKLQGAWDISCCRGASRLQCDRNFTTHRATLHHLLLGRQN
jgi:hypothetical protein